MEGNEKEDHVVLPLRVRIKGENGEGWNFVDVTSLTNSGLRLEHWVERALTLKEKKVQRNFPF